MERTGNGVSVRPLHHPSRRFNARNRLRNKALRIREIMKEVKTRGLARTEV
ncbi:MAG: hypothetical protein ACOYL3_05135 [Desulfuromonadaceae bacterium]